MAGPLPQPIDLLHHYRDHGRSFVAARTIKSGEVILSEKPILLYPSASTTTSSSYCHRCFRSLPPDKAFVPCFTCGTPFCSVNCHSIAATSLHTPFVCRAYCLFESTRKEKPFVFDEEQVLFLIAAYNLALVNPGDFHLLLSLHGRGDPTKASTVLLHDFIVSLHDATHHELSVIVTADLLAKDAMNAFGLMEGYDKSMVNGNMKLVRGYGIYVYASCFNHDCLPNVCRFDYLDRDSNDSNDSYGQNSNTEISIRAIHEISQGNEICLSYFPVNWTYNERQHRLKEDYGFQCSCDRCLVEKKWNTGVVEEDDAMESAKNSNEEFPHAYFFLNFMCSRLNCGGTLAHLPPSVEGVVSDQLECSGCGIIRHKDDIDYDVDDDDDESDEDMIED